MPYKIGLCNRVVSMIEKGMSQTKASEVYKVGRKTIYSWLRLKQTTSHLEPKRNLQKGLGIMERDAFKKFVDAHPDFTQEEIAKYFSVGSSTVGCTLNKIGYSPSDVPQNVVKK